MLHQKCQPQPELAHSTTHCMHKRLCLNTRRMRHSPRALHQESTAPVGKCYLIGAGLGPSDYLTVKAARVLGSASVCIYDDLGASGADGQDSPLELLPLDCKKIYAGKRGGQSQSAKQPEIDDLLVSACREGRTVVRLKGGCPSVFSRVTSEMAALEAAGCPYEFVPGISSALAAPLLAGFPLTQAEQSTSFAVTSGHDLEQDWSAFAAIPTLVVLMAGRNLSQIAERLRTVGWGPDTPVCIIHAAGIASKQKIWRLTLESVAQDPPKEKLSPCIMVFGRVAGLGLQHP